MSSSSLTKDSLLDHIELFELIFHPWIILIGLCGNSMALLLIHTNYNLRRLPSNCYLSVLAIGSSLFLVSLFLRWLGLATGWRIYNSSAAGCKALTFLAHLVDFLCIWMIVAVSLDRMIVLFKPQWRKKFCTLAAARRCTLSIIVLSLFLYSWTLPLANIVYTGPTNKNATCDVRKEDVDLFAVLMGIDTTICTVIPSLLVCLSNGLSVRKYRAYVQTHSPTPRVRFRSSLTSNQQTIPESTPLDPNSRRSTGPPVVTITGATLNATEQQNGMAVKPMRSADLQLTRTLLLVTTFFIVLNLPSYTTRIYYQFLGKSIDTTPFRILETIAYSMHYIHHAILFYLYIFWSPQMKKELKPTALKLLECYCCKTVPDFGHDTSATT